MKTLAVLAVLGALLTGAVVQAKETPVTKQVVKSLTGVPAAELPATIVMLVQATPKANQPAIVDAVIREVAKKNPGALRAVVIALAKANPSWAAVAAAAASKASPESVAMIMAAASTAAPEEAARIVAAVSRVTTASRAALAETVAQANPSVNAINLTREATQVRVDVAGGAADAPSGGTVFFPTPTGGIIGYTMGGDEVTGPPTSAPVTTGGDPDRYASSGS